MLALDQNGGYVVWAFGITVVALGGYTLYLRSRLMGLRRRAAQAAGGPARVDEQPSAENRLSVDPLPGGR
jgi:hypothetical protein